MKRSEMLKKLKELLPEYLQVEPEDPETILSVIELAGMLPPVIDKSKEHPNARFIYKWEEENET